MEVIEKDTTRKRLRFKSIIKKVKENKIVIEGESYILYKALIWNKIYITKLDKLNKAINIFIPFHNLSIFFLIF